MQTITPVDLHIDNDWRDGGMNGSAVRKSSSATNRGGRQALRMRTCVMSKVKPNKTKSAQMTSEVTQSKSNLPVRSRSPSPTREPWVPPPGRTTKGQKFAPQNAKTRLETPTNHFDIVSDDVTDEDGQNHDRQSVSNNSPLLAEIQTYEKRIQGLVEGVEILKERVYNRLNSDQIRSDIVSSLRDLEQSQQASFQTTLNKPPLRSSRSSPPSRHNYRSSSAGEQRKHQMLPRVSFEHDLPHERRRARSTTPVRGPLYLNPNRERLLISLSQSEADIAQITKQLSSVKDILTKLKFSYNCNKLDILMTTHDNHPVSFEVEQLYQQRNQLLHLIEQFEHSNRKLKEFLQHQYHLEAEDGAVNEKTDGINTRLHELERENVQIRRLLLDRENDNIALQNELERERAHVIGYDTMKTSLEHNRAHLQRELYAKEGEINRLQCIIRSLERNRSQCDTHRSSVKRTPSTPLPSCSSLPSLVAKTKANTIEKLQAELNDRDRHIVELEKKMYGNKNEQLVDANTEIIRLRTKLEHTERLVAEYKEQLHNQALKTSINNNKSHLSEIELDKLRYRLQKRIEELEPLPELLRQAELKNQDLQARLAEQTTYMSELKAKSNVQNHILDRLKDDHFSPKNESLQRHLNVLEEDNATLLRNLNAKEDALRNAQARLNAKTHELSTMSKQIDVTQSDLKTREDTFNSKERALQQRINELEQQISKLRLDCTQIKRDKDDAERRYTSQLSELRDKLEQSNNNNRSIQSYVDSLKTTYATVFNDNFPASLTGTPFSRYTSTPSVFP
ncbi:unnamed protein product [Adineta ricciae]|uniref:Uncharacterized protein n=1 Tax=Adineta ricciae TaxID=249248 RepID=A0A813RA59_ADIRI|nr:unnamed protein product [Adineta ricciae]